MTDIDLLIMLDDARALVAELEAELANRKATHRHAVATSRPPHLQPAKVLARRVRRMGMEPASD